MIDRFKAARLIALHASPRPGQSRSDGSRINRSNIADVQNQPLRLFGIDGQLTFAERASSASSTSRGYSSRSQRSICAVSKRGWIADSLTDMPSRHGPVGIALLQCALDRLERVDVGGVRAIGVGLRACAFAEHVERIRHARVGPAPDARYRVRQDLSRTRIGRRSGECRRSPADATHFSRATRAATRDRLRHPAARRRLQCGPQFSARLRARE